MSVHFRVCVCVCAPRSPTRHPARLAPSRKLTTQMAPLGHALPHAPQLAASVDVSRHWVAVAEHVVVPPVHGVRPGTS